MKRLLFLAAIVAIVFPVDKASADIAVFNDSFAGSADGPLTGGAPLWEGQAHWNIAGGMVTNSNSWQRARRFGGFRAEVGESVKITLSGLSMTGTGNGADNFAFGFQKTNEHTGIEAPQVRAGLNFGGTSLTVGGATDTGYNSGDIVDVMLTFERTGADAWSLSSMINNLTDGTMFSGSATPDNLGGMATPETVGQWMDADGANQILYGMRGLNNGSNVNTLAISGIALDVIQPIPEPSAAIVFCAIGFGLITRRRK